MHVSFLLFWITHSELNRTELNLRRACGDVWMGRGHGWPELNQINLNLTRLNWTGRNWTELDGIELKKHICAYVDGQGVWMNLTGPNLTKPDWTEVNRRCACLDGEGVLETLLGHTDLVSLFGGNEWLWKEPFGVKHCLTMMKRFSFLEEVCGSEKSLLVWNTA